MPSYTPTDAMRTEAQRGLDWRSEHGRGGTDVGIARARDITNGKDLPLETVKRMFSFFSRHEVDKQAQGFRPGEDGYPSNGRIAWALWSGDAGQTWAKRIVDKEKKEELDRFFSALSVLFPFNRTDSASMPDAAVASFFNDYIVPIDSMTFCALLESMGDKVRIHPSAKIFAASDWLKMAGIDARSIAAKVIKMKTFGNFSFDELVAKSVRGNKLLLSSSSGQNEVAVTPGGFSAFPVPAIIIARAFVDLAPESFFCVHNDLFRVENPNGNISRTFKQEKRPYPNEHAARLEDPAQFDEFRRENNAGGEGIDFIYGINVGGSQLQAIRFDAERFTPDQAQTWLEEHEFEPILFEEATMEREIDKRHIVGVDETEDAFIIKYSKKSEDYEEPDTPEAEAVEEEMEMEASREVPLGQTVYRSGEVRMMDEDRRMMMSISSTTPVEREFGYEILDHSTSSVDLQFLTSGRAPLLLDHDPRQQIGVIERAWMDGEKLRAEVRYSKSERAEEIYQDVRDGIRGNVSIGYQVMGMTKLDEMREGRPVYRVNKFRPLEVSMVSIPADPAVGVGRALPDASGVITKPDTQESQMSAVEITHEPDVQSRQKEIESIVSWGKRHNQSELANEALLKGWTGEQFREQLLERLESKPMQTVTPDVSAKEKQAYSLVKAIRAAKLNDWSQAGLELEMSREIAKRSHRDPKGFFVPDFGWNVRTVSTASGATFGAGSNIVPEDYRGDRFIDALISTSILGTVGATVLNGLQGNVAIPKMATSTSAGWIAEGGSVGNNEPDFGQVTMTPKLLANKVNITRELMIQSDPSVEQLIRNNMVRIFAAAIDNAALKGGTSNAPTGVLATSGIGDVSSGGTSGNTALTYGNVVDIWSEVAADNALVGSLSWVTHPRVVGKLMQTVVASSTDSRMIMMGPDELLGYRVVQTTQTPGSGDGSSTPYSLLFGNFSDLLIGFWSALDVLVDPYGSAGTASTNIYFYQDVDVAVGHPESFAAAQDVTV